MMIVVEFTIRASVSMCPSVMSRPASPTTQIIRRAPSIDSTVRSICSRVVPGFRFVFTQHDADARTVPVTLKRAWPAANSETEFVRRRTKKFGSVSRAHRSSTGAATISMPFNNDRSDRSPRAVPASRPVRTRRSSTRSRRLCLAHPTDQALTRLCSTANFRRANRSSTLNNTNTDQTPSPRTSIDQARLVVLSDTVRTNGIEGR